MINLIAAIKNRDSKRMTELICEKIGRILVQKEQKCISRAKRKFKNFFRKKGFFILAESRSRIVVFSGNIKVELNLLRPKYAEIVKDKQVSGILFQRQMRVLQIVVEEIEDNKIRIDVYSIHLHATNLNNVSTLSREDQEFDYKQKLMNARKLKFLYTTKIKHENRSGFEFDEILSSLVQLSI